MVEESKLKRKTKSSPAELEIINTGDSVEAFKESDTEMKDVEYSTEQIHKVMLSRKLGKVTIKIEVECGNTPTSFFEDKFNIYLKEKEIEDNIKVMQNKLINASNQIKKLVVLWNNEVR